jgi:predicted SAM-dependent methyltransferase
MTIDPAYETYWKRKKLLMGSNPQFPVRRWWQTDGLSDIEQLFYEVVRDRPHLLDVGAGDLRIMNKLQQAGYRGEYHTLDTGTEGEYTYRDLREVSRAYSAILCLDVIEHLPLREGLTLLNQMTSILPPGGVLVVQTPNAYYVPDPLSWDMTHVHKYNLPDLWAHFTCQGFDVAGYRVVLRERRQGPIEALRSGIVAYVKKKILACDYANNIVLIVRKPG